MQNSEWKRRLVLPAFCILHSALLMVSIGCGSKARAETLPDGPPLAVPVAPAHQIAIEQIAEAPPPTPPVVAAPQPQPEAPTVRAAPATGSATEGKVKALLSQAETDLAKRVDYQKLSPDGRAQYEQSKRFAEEARQAMKERNFLLALTLAEKAANIAAELIR